MFIRFKIKPNIVFVVILLVLFNFFNWVHAQVLTPIIQIENPANLSNQSGDIIINGFAVSTSTINKIDIYVDGKYVQQATYGLTRTDIANSYSGYPNSLNSGFSFKLNSRGYIDGLHEIKAEATDVNSNKISSIINVQITNQRTLIMGQAVITKEQMIKYFQQNNTVKDYNYINNFVSILFEEATTEGVRADLAFAQMVKETNFLKFTGTVKEEQNNFAGIGATGGTVTGATFPDIRTGIRADIQHLKAYASNENLVLGIVDPRFKYVTRASSPYAEWLGINENPNGYGWASDLNYGYDIVNRVGQMSSIQINTAGVKLNNFSAPTNTYAGNNINITATATTVNRTLYRFWIQDPSKGQWVIVQDYSENNTLNWTPTSPGTYGVAVHIKDEFSNSVDDYSNQQIVVKSNAVLTGFNVPTSACSQKTTTISATATATSKPLYRFWVQDPSKGPWVIVQDYSENNTLNWTPAKPGTYGVAVHVKDQLSNSVDDYSNKQIEVKLNAALTGFNVPISGWVQKSTTISASATSINKPLYRFWIQDPTKGPWVIAQDYSENGTLNWTPTKPGTYGVAVHVKDQLSNNVDDYSNQQIVVNSNAVLTGFNVPANVWSQNSVTISANATATNKPLYRFWIQDPTKGPWVIVQDYSENGTLNWTPTKPGTYGVAVHVKDQLSNSVDDYSNQQIIVQANAVLTRFNIPTNIWINTSVTISASATAINKPLYRFWIKDPLKGIWETVQDYSENNTLNWLPTKPGTYGVAVHVKDQLSNSVDDYSNQEIVIKSNATLIGFTVPASCLTQKSILISANATAINKPLYRFWIQDPTKGPWVVVQDYSESNTLNWTPSKPGTYGVAVHVKDRLSNSVDDYSNQQIVVKSNATLIGFNVPTSGWSQKSITISASASAINKPLYRFWIQDPTKGPWVVVQDYSESNILNWTPTKPGTYGIAVHIKDQLSNSVDDYSNMEIIINSKTIVIDPGHNYGGDDGAYATVGGITYSERDLNMQMSLKLKAELEKLGYNIILTRQATDQSTDIVQTSLQKRVDIANGSNADLFISLHHDVSGNPATAGISTHYSTFKPGIDNDGIVTGNDPNGWYTGVNIDSSPSNAANISAYLANKLADGLSSSLGYTNLKAHDHNLFVTVNTNMPAVLIEEGFISNQAEAQKCADPLQQNSKAQIIAKIINDYFIGA